MTKTSQVVRGVASNWIALGFSVGVAFFLSPFIVHSLGNVAYGVWTLANSVVSHMVMLDLGLRGAVTRFVSRDHSLGNHAESSRAVSTALWIRLWIGLATVLISLVLANLAARAFPIPAEMEAAAHWVIVLIGLNLAISLVCGIFGGVLAALHRFDLLSGLSLAQTALRAAGVVWLLKSGHGIVALAAWELAVAVLANLGLILLCFRIYPELRLSFGRPEQGILRNLWNYSFYGFAINIMVQLIYYTDNVVVGAFVSAEAVTFYAIGGGLIEYLRQLVASLTVTFTPLASMYEGQGQQRRLQQLLIQGTRAAMLIALPIECALFFRGPTFIGLWMGPEYLSVSGQVLQILVVAQVFAIANYTSGGIAYGLGKHRPVAVWASAEAIANLGLSIFLVHRIGLLGVAWGTTLTSLVTSVILWPLYISRILAMPTRQYLWQSWIRPALAATPYAVACYVTERYWPAEHLAEFFLQIVAILPVFLLGAAACFWKDYSWHWRLDQATKLTFSVGSPPPPGGPIPAVGLAWPGTAQGPGVRAGPRPEAFIREPKMSPAIRGNGMPESREHNRREPAVISVLIATRNRASRLRQALETLFSPSNLQMPGWEVIVVDNDSTDNTRDVLREFQERLLTQVLTKVEKRRGKSYALNTAIEMARGELFVFTDDDVLCAPDYIQAVRTIFEQYPVQGAQGRILLDCEGGRPAWMGDDMAAYLSLRDYGDQVFEWKDNLCGCNMAVRADAVRKIGGFAPGLGPGGVGLGDDSEFSVRLRQADCRFIYAPQISVRHQIPRSRLTKTFIRKRFYDQGRYVAHIDPLAVPLWRFAAYVAKDTAVGELEALWRRLTGQPALALSRQCTARLRVGYLYEHWLMSRSAPPPKS